MTKNKVKCLFGYHNWTKWYYCPTEYFDLYTIIRRCQRCKLIDDMGYDNMNKSSAKRVIHFLNDHWNEKEKKVIPYQEEKSEGKICDTT